jgi:hypothetical protein
LNERWDGETMLVVVITFAISLFTFLYSLWHGYVLLYGDAVAHINIVRRVFDSRTPGPLQLGTVWLPLQHVLMLPFVISKSMWTSGVGGSIPSMAAFVLGALGIFRVVRGALSFHGEPDLAVRLTAWFAAAIYAGNPNLIYLQSTAMTEPLYMGFFIWAVVYFSEFAQQVGWRRDEGQRRASASLVKCGWCLLGATLTRYDGWFLAVIVVFVALWMTSRRNPGARRFDRSFRKFVLLAAIGPVLWVVYNGIVYRNALEFANGPYSAKAIEQKTCAPGCTPHPGTNDLPVAASYFVKSAELNVAAGNWGRAWLLLLVLGTAMVAVFELRLWPLLLLWVPLPFYMLSVAYSGVPVFIPPWWPYTHYNVRYGLELLPAFAVFIPLLAYFLANFVWNSLARLAVAALTVALIAGSYGSVWRSEPICFCEAWINSRTRLALEHELATTLEQLPPKSTFLMYLGDHVGALQDAGIPLRRTINEGNHRSWKRPTDPQGLWERALADPAKYVDYVVAIDDDPVVQATRAKNLFLLTEIHVNGQPAATIYATHPTSR